MDWIILLVLAYFLISIASLTDKFLLTKAINDPVFYTVIISTLGLVVLILAPFGFAVPSLVEVLITALAGVTYTVALFFLYSALIKGEASRVITLTGALTSLFTFILSFLFIEERLQLFQLVAFGLLLAGGCLISLEKKTKKTQSYWIIYSVLGALLYGVSYTAARYDYDTFGFVNGFIWLRIFAFITALVFLLYPKNIKRIKDGLKQGNGVKNKKTQVVLTGAQILNGIGFLILNYIISLTSAALVLASQGIQYAFVLIFTLVLSSKFPKVLKEKYSSKILIQKVFAVFLIAAGLVFLTINNI